MGWRQGKGKGQGRGKGKGVGSARRGAGVSAIRVAKPTSAVEDTQAEMSSPSAGCRALGFQVKP